MKSASLPLPTRREFITLVGGLAAAWPQALHAQNNDAVRRIGILIPGRPDDRTYSARASAFKDGLKQLGWVEGRNVSFDTRWSDDRDQLRTYATELVRSGPDVILAAMATSLVHLKEATSTVPIVFAFVADPVGNGFVGSLSKPGGNITGFANYEQTVGVKWAELLKQIAPRVSRATFVLDQLNPLSKGYLEAAQKASASLGLSVSDFPVHRSDDIQRIPVTGDHDEGLVVGPGPNTTTYRDLIIRFAADRRLPAVFPTEEDVEGGGLAFYGVDPIDLFRRAASYVDRILKGEKVGDLPVQYATKFTLAINLKTAKQLGLDVPISLLARTDRVIE